MSQNPRTICFFNTNRAWGGGEKWHFTTAKELGRKGHKTILATNRGSELYKRARSERLNAYDFSVGNLSFLNPIKILILAAFLKSKKIDAIILNLPQDLKLAGIAAKIAGVQKIIYRRGMPHPLRNTFLNRFLFKSILTHVVVNSEEIGRSLADSNKEWFPKEKLRLIYNGVLPLNSENKNKLYVKKSDEVVIGNAGRLTDQKGQIYLIEMAQMLKNMNISFHLLIAGEGELREQLTKTIQDKNLQKEITLLGHVTKMDEFFNSLDIFVFPSKFEGSANTLIETIQHGVPCIAFDVSSNPEIIQNGVNGFLATPFEPASLLNFTQEIINHPELREKFKSANDRIVSEKFDASKNLKILEDIIS